LYIGLYNAHVDYPHSINNVWENNMINKKSGLFFVDKEVPIISGEDLKDFKPNSHRIAIWDDGVDTYSLRGLKGYGLFAVKIVGVSDE